MKTVIVSRQDTTRDLDRFTQAIRNGSLGPYDYALLLGITTLELRDLLKGVASGFPIRVYDRFLRNSGLSSGQLADLMDVPQRTLARRRDEGRFAPDESDRLLRAARILGSALALFEGDRDAALEWLMTPQPAFGGAIPIALAKTELGSREVESLAGRLEHGVYS